MSANRSQVEAVLADEGLEHDAALLRAVDGLVAALVPAEAPVPSGALTQLFAAAAGAPEAPATAPLAVVPAAAPTALAPVVEITRSSALKAEAAAAAAVRPRWVKRHRGAMIGALVAVGMGLGASGVAAMGGQIWDAQEAHRPAVGPATSLLPQDVAPTVPSVAGRTDVPGESPSPEPQQTKDSQGGNAPSQDSQGQNENSQGSAPHDARQGGGSGRTGAQGSSGQQGSAGQGGGSQGANH